MHWTMQNRLQGRSRSERDPSSPQIPIIQHADVRRMLLAQNHMPLEHLHFVCMLQN